MHSTLNDPFYTCPPRLTRIMRIQHRLDRRLRALTRSGRAREPSAALPPYGCGVPLAGCERPVTGNSTVQGRWCTSALPDVSLRGGAADVAISQYHVE